MATAELIAEPTADLEDGWRALAEAQGNAFLTPEWHAAWRSAYAGAGDAIVAVHRSDGSLRGVLPLVGPSGRPRSLRFAGASLGDHFGPACAPGDEEAVAGEAATVLAEHGGWSAMVLDYVDADARWPAALGAGVGPSMAEVSYREAVLPWIALDGVEDWEAYLATRSRNLRSQIRRAERALEREHDVRYRLTGSEDELASDLETFFRLHYARWQARGGSTSASERARSFHRDFAGSALRRGWLRLWTLELDGEAVASWYGWRIGTRYAYYLAGFDPARGELKPGFVLLAHTLRSAIEEDASEYDMLLGDEPYKLRLATDQRSVRTVSLVRARHPARLAIAAEAAIWRAGQRMPAQRRRRLRAAAGAVLDRLPGSRSR